MNYFVVWPDGQKFGPADLATLSQWAKEGRINDETVLEEAETGKTLKMSEVDGIDLAWEDPTPMPPEPSAADYEVMQAVASDRPIGDTHFEIPQEFPMSSGSPYPVESYYKKGKNELSTAWALIAGGFAIFFIPCCGIFTFGGIAMVSVGIYNADKAMKAGEEGAKTARTVGIIALILQVCMIVAYFALVAWMFVGGMGGGSFRP